MLGSVVAQGQRGILGDSREQGAGSKEQRAKDRGQGKELHTERRTSDSVGCQRAEGQSKAALVDPNLLSIEPDDWIAAIVKSHNYGRDFAALEKLLPMNLRYVGLIGPRKRRDQLMNHLLDLEVTINAGFFAPAGLELGAETPEEIALSIVAASYAGTLGVPVLFDRSLLPELLRLDDSAGAKSIILSNRDQVAEFPFPEGEIDIDTAEDWQRFCCSKK